VPRGKKLPDDVIDHWPEVFKDVRIEAVPIEYVNSVLVTFVDGKVWDIDLSKNTPDLDVTDALEDLIEEYEDAIVNIDFRLDTERVKEDVTKRTKMFLKKRK
jgi:hypothetical protein